MSDLAGGSQEAMRATPREGESPRPRPAFTPSKHLLSDHQRIVRVQRVTIFVLLAGLAFVWLSISTAAREQKVMVIDPVGGLTQGPLEPLANSKGFFSITSINAVQAALQRSAAGFDLHEMLAIYFSAKARQALEEDLGKRHDDMRRRRLTMKPVVDSLTPPQEAGAARIVRVSGRLQTTGAVNGRVFYDEPPFELIFSFRVNSDLSNKATMPWVVDDFELAIGSAEIEAQRARNQPRG